MYIQVLLSPFYFITLSFGISVQCPIEVIRKIMFAFLSMKKITSVLSTSDITFDFFCIFFIKLKNFPYFPECFAFGCEWVLDFVLWFFFSSNSYYERLLGHHESLRQPQRLGSQDLILKWIHSQPLEIPASTHHQCFPLLMSWPQLWFCAISNLSRLHMVACHMTTVTWRVWYKSLVFFFFSLRKQVVNAKLFTCQSWN